MGRYGEPYTMEQTVGIVQVVKDGTPPVPEKAKEALLALFDFAGMENADADAVAAMLQNEPNEEVAVWPKLAEAWLETIFRGQNMHLANKSRG